MGLLGRAPHGSGPPAVSALEAARLADTGAVLLDVRRVAEWRVGRVAGSRLLPLDELPDRLDEVPRDVRVVAVCRSGRRSGLATQALRGLGLDVVNLAGGLLGWSEAGLPLVTEDGRPGRVA